MSEIQSILDRLHIEYSKLPPICDSTQQRNFRKLVEDNNKIKDMECNPKLKKSKTLTVEQKEHRKAVYEEHGFRTKDADRFNICPASWKNYCVANFGHIPGNKKKKNLKDKWR